MTSTGDSPRIASLIHKNPEPQISASSPMRTVVARFTVLRPGLLDGHVVEQAVVIVLGVLVLGGHITLLVLAGIALILAGVALTRNQVVRESAREPR